MDDAEQDIVDLFLQRVKDASTREGLLRLVKLMLVANIDASQVQLAACKELCSPASLSSLAEDQWVVLEAGAQAAVRHADLPFAKACLGKLDSQFPSSARVNRLRLLVQECEATASSEGGGRSAVERGYKAALAANEADTTLIKRLIAMKKESGSVESALDVLGSYLEGLGASDVSAWLECAELQLESGSHAKAAFCMEELILIQPSNPAYHARLAELLCHLSAQLGPEGEGVDKARMARLHASEAVRLTHKASPTALAALADACYAHARLSAGCAVRPSELLLPCKPLRGGDKAAAGPVPVPVPVGAQKKVTEAVQESLDLHAFAVSTLATLRTGPVGARLQSQAGQSVSVAGLSVRLSSIFPALALEAGLLGEAAKGKMQTQAEAISPS